MAEKTIQQTHQGSRYKLIHCKNAIDSFHQALARLPKAKKASLERQMILQIERLINGQQMSKENFPKEGQLPNRSGHAEKKFHALKRIPIRGYCWFSTGHPATVFMSHYIYKDQDKLKQNDTTIVGNNWTRIEINGDDY